MSIERIKFRGKATEKYEHIIGRWLFSTDFDTQDKHQSTAEFFRAITNGLIDPATVGQFTGLVDSKGVDVYEGDELGGNYGNGYVKWCDECKSFQYYAPMDMPECFGCIGDLHWNEIVDDKENIEVIGNVHEVTP